MVDQEHETNRITSNGKCVDNTLFYILQIFGLSVGPVCIEQGSHSRHTGAHL